MGAFTKLTYHIVFGTKYRRPTIRPDFKERLSQYLGGVIRAEKGCLLEIGGIEDHVHLLANLSPSKAIADTIRIVKTNSSKWTHEVLSQTQFEWQKGYGAFTVSISQIETVREYIRSQPEHHQSRSFEEEYIEILERHGVPFERKWLFEDEYHG